MSSNSQWQKHYSEKNKLFYYYHMKDHTSLWVVESPEHGWGRMLLDQRHPERGEKYVNILTNRSFYSEADYKRYIESIKKDDTDESSKSVRKGVQSISNQTRLDKRELPQEDEFTSLGSGFITQENKESEFSTMGFKPSGDVNDVAVHYSKRRNLTESERKGSRILHLRTLNNWIKYTLIHDYCPANSRVLDLACGKGGDLKKWKEQHIRHYVGVDIAEGSIHDALRRFKDIAGINFPARFAVANLGTCDLSDWLELGEKFDLISCQFALHYLFEKEEWLRCFFQNISTYLKVGGHFIATLSDCGAVTRLLRSRAYYAEEEYVWRNGICCIAMTDDNMAKIDKIDQNPYGIEYRFTLAESVDDVPESLAPTELIEKLCKEYHFELEKKINFHDYIREKLPKYRQEYSRMNVPNETGGLTKDETEVAQVYCVLVLKRVLVEDDSNYDQYDTISDTLGKLPKWIDESDIVSLLR